MLNLNPHLKKKEKSNSSFVSDDVLKSGIKNEHNELVTKSAFSQKDNFIKIDSNVFEGVSNNDAPMEDIRKFFKIIKTEDDGLYKNQWAMLFSKVFLNLFCNATFIVLFLLTIFLIFKEKLFFTFLIFAIMICASYIIKWINTAIDPFKKDALNNQYKIISSYSKRDIMKAYVSSPSFSGETRSMISYDDIIKGNRYSIFIGFVKEYSERGYEVFCIAHDDSYSKFIRNIKSFNFFYSEENPIYDIHNNMSSNHFGKDDITEHLYGSIGDDIDIGSFFDETRIINYKQLRTYDYKTKDMFYIFYNKRISFNLNKETLAVGGMRGNLACYDKDGYKENND